ncbi:MAG: class I SAM-dependent methyltransferase [Bacteroidales bacterium]|jgi:predicted O-methyltransferase YrrM|nr:class I SAM-dependent methyltransferase [Bacteroidales bacterium]
MFIFRTFKYLSYFLTARHKKGHGIHSPFVYDLVSRLFRNKTDLDTVLLIEKIRKKNKSDKRTIQVLDLGAGSVIMKISLRKVSEIAGISAVPEKYGVLLSRLAAEFGNPDIVEFGTSLGFSTMYMAKGSPESVIYTMEGCPATSEIAKENFREAGIGNIRLLTGSFEDMIPELLKKAVNPGLIFIDGNHRKEPVMNYFRQMARMADKDTVIVIDDIHHSTEMEEAWTGIKHHEKVTFTIDIFRMGLVFFRGGMNHSDYVIKY